MKRCGWIVVSVLAGLLQFGCGEPAASQGVPAEGETGIAAEIARLSGENQDALQAVNGLTALLNPKKLTVEDRCAVLLARAAVQERIENWPAARQDYEAVLQDAGALTGQKVQALRGRAYISRMQERWPEALADYTAILGMPDVAADERAQVLARRGIIYFVNKDAERATADFSAAVAISGTSGETQFDVARLHAQGLVIGGDLAGGLAAFADLLQRPGLSDERKMAIFQERAQIYWRHGHLSEALADLSAAMQTPGISAAPKAWLQYNRGRIQVDRGAVGANEAIADFTAVVNQSEVPPRLRTQAQMERALEYLGTGAYAEADADADRLLKTAGLSDDDRARVLGIQAGCRLAAQDARAAISRLTTALALPGLSAEIRNSTRLRRAQICTDAGQLSDAKADCSAILADPGVDADERGGALQLRAGILIHEGNFDAAEQDLQRILRAGEDVPAAVLGEARFALAELFEQRGMVEKALPLYGQLIDDVRTLPLDRLRGLDQRGTLYAQTGESEKALADFAAIVAAPRAPVEFIRAAQFRRMLVFYQLRSFEAALKEINLAIGPAEAPVEAASLGLYYFRARILTDLSRPKEAIPDLQRCLAGDPDPETRYLMGLNLVLDGQPDEALKVYREALAEDNKAKILTGAPLEELRAAKKSHPDRAEDVDTVLKGLGIAAAAPVP